MHPHIINTRRAQGLAMSSFNRRRRQGSHRAALALVASLLAVFIAVAIIVSIH